ncbi:Bug family tripartite tricarboxylate transporter substrate binding protein [Pollutimonas harenae]|uniref:Tripartite tricarboxylate transporter substrate binding protein n=1 Tax=Pollutimonas harenae TaxID=657015 RepID=A0A853GXU4_9BURK|nr:tripartite tricarboxylate transporter substrate binding protein [Pollutimonas harenae]NYT84600.1 tripartite tricarboxylate transporter substrate binding protein [Pollutimonas harenae]TEA73009.1 tripartite tricarboxylate transporter substrate binding protein [Pollutimonas harenae]
MKSKRFFKAALLAATLPALMLNSTLATAQDDYPSRPITMVVGYSAGGATDILARLIAKSLTEELKQTVIVENKAGANSNIGAEYVARAKNDGYTIYVGTIANTINRSLYKDLRYDFVKDFEPIGLMATIPNVLVVNPKLPFKTVQDYIQYAKENPGKLTCASSGIGSSINMSCELFKIQTGTDILHVPYRGSGPAVTDLLGGQVDSMFDNLPSSLPHIQAGTLRPIATTTSKRVKALPDTPTFAEEGVKDFVVQSWFGLNAPAGTPEPVIKRLNEALNKALAKPEVVAAYDKNGFTAPEQPNSPDSLKQYTQAEIDKWKLVVEKANLSAN